MMDEREYLRLNLTCGCLVPVPVIMTGLCAVLNNLMAASTAPTWGPGGNDGGDAIDPQAMSFG